MCASRHQASGRSPSPSSWAKAVSTFSNRCRLSSTVSRITLGRPCPSLTIQRFPTTIPLSPSAAAHTAVFLPMSTSSSNSSVRSGTSFETRLRRSSGRGLRGWLGSYFRVLKTTHKKCNVLSQSRRARYDPTANRPGPSGRSKLEPRGLARQLLDLGIVAPSERGLRQHPRSPDARHVGQLEVLGRLRKIDSAGWAEAQVRQRRGEGGDEPRAA